MNGRTYTQKTIDAPVVWSSLLVYFAVWSGCLSNGFERNHLIPALLISTIYVAMHIYEITARHHCLLSADSTALPVTLAASVAIGCYAHFARDVTWLQIVPYAARGCAAFIVGHILALLYCAVATAALERCLHQRIAAETPEGNDLEN